MRSAAGLRPHALRELQRYPDPLAAWEGREREGEEKGIGRGLPPHYLTSGYGPGSSTQTDGHRTVTQTFTAYYAASINNLVTAFCGSVCS